MTPRPLLATGLVTILLAVTTARAAVPASTEPPRYANLGVETTIVGEAAEVVRRRVRERGAVLLRRAAVLPARDAKDTTITVAVREIRGDDPGYSFEVGSVRDGAPVGNPVAGSCRLCTEGELVEAIERELDVVIAKLPHDAAAPAARAPTEPLSDRLGPRGIAGATLVALGGAATVSGIGLAAAPPRLDDDPRFLVSTRPIGYAVLGAGVATAIVGAVLLAVDRRANRRRRASLSIDIGRDALGLVAGGRF